MIADTLILTDKEKVFTLDLITTFDEEHYWTWVRELQQFKVFKLILDKEYNYGEES